jgi:ATP-dependent protease HslVU (ClpYQ) peptidase subunit
MTCIVAIKTKDAIFMGGDSAGGNAYGIQSRSDPKVFRSGGFVIGYTTSYRMGQILQHGFEFVTPEGDPDAYMFSLCNAVASKLTDLNYAKLENNVIDGGTFLIGWKNHLYAVYDNFQYARFRDNYAAIGSGEEYALGSLFSTQSIDDPIKRITIALDAATKFSSLVAKPYIFEHT